MLQFIPFPPPQKRAAVEMQTAATLQKGHKGENEALMTLCVCVCFLSFFSVGCVLQEIPGREDWGEGVRRGEGGEVEMDIFQHWRKCGIAYHLGWSEDGLVLGN